MSIRPLALHPSASHAFAPRRLVILGATGSIGRSTLDVLRASPGRFEVVAVVGGRDGAELARVAVEVGARFAAIADPDGLGPLKAALGASGIRAGAGPSAVLEAALMDCDLVVAAIVGTAGLAPTHAALDAGRDVALANKECLVCAGTAFMRTAVDRKATVLPMDSEHNAIHQALGGADPATITQMILTASGGPFRTWSKDRIAAATRDEALAHPNWSMGPKITIDSASMMNKGLELIEAHHLFGVPADKLDVLVHPQSIVHGLVAFGDGAVTAGMGSPDMKVPIAHCLGWPQRIESGAKRLDLAAVATLTFEAPDYDRFPAPRLALEALRTGRGLPGVLNGANEIAVAAFLDRRIGFTDIVRIVEAVCDQCVGDGTACEPASIAEALAVDHVARNRAAALLA